MFIRLERKRGWVTRTSRSFDSENGGQRSNVQGQAPALPTSRGMARVLPVGVVRKTLSERESSFSGEPRLSEVPLVLCNDSSLDDTNSNVVEKGSSLFVRAHPTYEIPP